MSEDDVPVLIVDDDPRAVINCEDRIRTPPTTVLMPNREQQDLPSGSHNPRQ
jgi:hypothetical protein